MSKVQSIRRGLACLTVGALCIAAGANARADEQSDRIKALEQRLERSLQLIDKLSSRVAELERAARAAPVAAQAASGAQPAQAAVVEDHAKSIAALQQSVDQIADGLSKNANDTGIPVHGFIDVGAGWSSRHDPVPLRGFNAGSLDLYLTPQIGARVKSLVELVVEFDEDGESSIDMERVQIGYTLSDELTLWAGRFHTPFGLWNTSYHHGANLQPSISRPVFIDFEDRGGLISAHSVGVWANGKTALGDGKLTYDAFLANGPSVRGRELELNPFTDDNHGKMLGLNLGYRPAGVLSGLSVGLHGFSSSVGRYNDDGSLRGTTKLRALGGYFGYDGRDWETIGEFYRFSNSSDSGSVLSNAGFLHVGRTFGAFTPYARYERASLNPRDDYFRSLRNGRSYTHLVAGARYAIDANSSLKLELRHSRETAAAQIDAAGAEIDVPEASFQRALFQYSIAF